jgi:hypothetical protein
MATGLAANWLVWLENTSWALTIRQSFWLYPGLEIIHITGIAILVGAAFMFDLRLLGYGRNLPVISLAQHLLSWSKRGLILVVPSGILLFITNAEAIGTDPTFWLKMVLLACGGLNALVFHRFTLKGPGDWHRQESLPLKAKAAAVISIGVWIAVIACGRMLAY